VLLARAIGTTARTRRAYLDGLVERAERLEREREALALVAVAEERERIARELHDIVAHSVSVMVVQSDGADAALQQENLAGAHKAIDAIGRTASRHLLRSGRVRFTARSRWSRNNGRRCRRLCSARGRAAEGLASDDTGMSFPRVIARRRAKLIHRTRQGGRGP
jgi:hypothetical protein